MRRPSMQSLAPEYAEPARKIASTLRAAGHVAWLVGGAVRDLALEHPVKDVDIATDALPDDVERLFTHTKGVGRAFGTMLVVVDGAPAQVTTFRSEAGYSDSRRPDRVAFGRSAEEDARRRDFTCNALFLDPLDDTLLDPTGGLDDLRARRLRCVGDARERFAEDGLRLVRMARFAAAFELQPDDETLAGARARAGSIVGVSGERLLGELETIFSRRRAHTAFRLLESVGVLERALPGQIALHPPLRSTAGVNELRWRALERLDAPVGIVRGFAVLFDATHGRGASKSDAGSAVLEKLKPSNEVRAALRDISAMVAALRALAALPQPRRSDLIRARRNARFADALAIACAWDDASDKDAGVLRRIAASCAEFSAADLRPQPWITSRELEECGVPRGPRWGELLHEAETLQLDAALEGRDAALLWLAARAGKSGGRERAP